MYYICEYFPSLLIIHFRLYQRAYTSLSTCTCSCVEVKYNDCIYKSKTMPVYTRIIILVYILKDVCNIVHEAVSSIECINLVNSKSCLSSFVMGFLSISLFKKTLSISSYSKAVVVYGMLSIQYG